MKVYNLPRIVHPLYVLVTGVLGIAIVVYMYILTFPYPNSSAGKSMAEAPSFLIWVFLIGVLFSFFTIVVLPAWIVFFRLYKYVSNENKSQSRKLIVTLIILTVLLFLLVPAFLFIPHKENIHYIPDLPQAPGIGERFIVIYVYTFLVLLPVGLGITLVNTIAELMTAKIPEVIQSEEKLFDFISDYLGYRNLLQTYLIVLGVVAGLNPLITAAYGAIGIDLGLFTNDNLPRGIIIVYGLLLTLVLIFIFAPAYYNLSNVGKRLRDSVYPMNSLDKVKDTITKRDELDNLLQNKVSLTGNIISGALSLSPLITSVLASLFQTK